MGIAQPELCSGNLIPASPLCLESSRISCMCILLLTTTRARARMWRRSPWHHGLHIIYTVAPCCSSPSSPTAHFTYPCKVHFPLLLGSPCGVLPPAGGMEEEERGCKGRVMGGEGKRMVVEWGDRLCYVISVMWEFTGTLLVIHFLVRMVSWVTSVTASRGSIIHPLLIGCDMLYSAIVSLKCVYVHVSPLHHRIQLLSSSARSHQRSIPASSLLCTSRASGGWTCVDSSHRQQRAQQHCSTYSKGPPTAHFYSFSCSFAAKPYAYPQRRSLTELFFIHLA